MRLVCARPHPRWDRPGDEGTLAFDTVGAWLLHHVLSHSPRMRERLIRIGFLDAESEGSLLFWRWDYQNARQAAWIRDFEQKEWERKGERTRAKWGEGSA